MPWPPSVNRIWRTVSINGRQRTLLSREGREYREEVCSLLNGYAKDDEVCFKGSVAVTVEASPPDKRRRDLDNVLKAAMDSLTSAGIWADDSQVDDLRILRKKPVVGGCLHVTVEG